MLCSYRDILEAVKKTLIEAGILGMGHALDAEAEGLVLGVVRRETGKNLSRLELYVSVFEASVEATLTEKIMSAAQQRAQGVPLQYIVGHQTFLDHEYQVGSGVLIPRPETECLCMTIIEHLKKASDVKGTQEGWIGLEIGLGSGVLSIELLLHFPQLKMVATELEPQAKHYAQMNVQRLLEGASNQKRLEILDVDSALEVFQPVRRWQSQSKQKFDFLVSNPPYLLRDANEVEAQVVAHEPHSALFSEDPLYFYRKMAQESDEFLTERGFVFLEVPHERAETIYELFSKAGWYCTVQKDLTGRDRVFIAQRYLFTDEVIK
jgi:release factor glutamine methyltransferase